MTSIKNIFANIKNFIFRKEEEFYPSAFCISELSGIAKNEGINDDFNKKIAIYSGGYKITEFSYDENIIKAIEDIYGIPFTEGILEDEDYEFDTIENIGVLKYRR